MPKSTPGDSDFSDYAPVADRILLFYKRYPSGRIITRLHSRTDHEVTFRALVYRELGDPRPAATGWASEREGDGDINAVACLENTETSAVGRALANLGFTASIRRPSREEIEKAARARACLVVRPTLVSEPAPGPCRSGASAAGSSPLIEGDPLQQRANAVHDVLDLLERAEALGFPVSRIGVVRAYLLATPLMPRRLSHLERRLRHWISRHRATALG